MKFSTVIVVWFFTMTGSSISAQCSCKLTASEKNLCLTANVDESVLILIRQETDSAFSQLTTVEYEFNPENKTYVKREIPQSGIVFTSDAESSYNIVLKLKEKLDQLGHKIFMSDKNKTENKYTVSIIKTTDQFDILRAMETSGGNYNISNELVIQKLSQWNTNYPFYIIGSGSDYVEAVFIKMPDDLEKFANEIYEFCPDVVDGASGSVKYLAAEMRDTGILYLWWK